MLTIGCHLSASDGFLAMGRTALDIGANTFQFFTRNPRGSKAKAIDPADAAALLELPDKNAVIKAQIPTGILLLIVNVFLLYFLMFL